MQARPDLALDPENPKVARGSVADVFRFRDRTSEGNAIAFKTVRADSLPRIQNEAAILMRMAKDCPAVGVVAGPNFAAALAEALRDARAFRFSTLHSTTNPGAMLSGLFFDALSSTTLFTHKP